MDADRGRPGGREGIVEAAVVSLALASGIAGGWFLAVVVLGLPDAPWRPIAAAVVLGVLAVLLRPRRRLIALVAGASLGNLFAWLAYVGGGFVVSHF